MGVWTGNDTENTVKIPVEALIDASGDFDIIRIGTPTMPADDAQFVGTATVSGANFATTAYQGFEPTGRSSFADGSTHGNGTISSSSTVSAGSSISALYSFTTDNGTTTSGSMALNFSSQTGNGSSLSAIGTTFTNSSDTNNYISIDPSSGAIKGVADVGGTNPGNCGYTGTVTILNANYNVYGVELVFASNCTGVYSPLSSATLKGFATLDSSTNPASVLLGVAGQSPGTMNNAFFFSGVE